MRALFASVILLLVAADCCAARLAFDFTGVVLPPGGTTFGEPVPFLTPVSGHFEYDTDSPSTHALDAFSTGYRQQIAGGFSATFGTTTVEASDYIVVIANDTPVSEDQFIVRFIDDDPSPLTPSLTSPLLVNGVPHTNGLFDINLGAPQSLFSSTDLPSSLDVSQLTGFSAGFLSDSATGSRDIFFQITSIQPGEVIVPTSQAPEPSVLVMAVLAAAAIAIRSTRFSRRVLRTFEKRPQ